MISMLSHRLFRSKTNDRSFFDGHRHAAQSASFNPVVVRSNDHLAGKAGPYRTNRTAIDCRGRSDDLA
ncbi:MAG: hypothetical protein GY894_03925 [Planctomycetes bacterium]|nr:hypothetical protein [Planctomycetota bacterium]